MASLLTNWIAPEGAVLPDFIICGAMKSGTSSVHYILNQHPDVFMPVHETHFFDIDNFFQHPDFSLDEGQGWISQAGANNGKRLWDWYSSQFKGRQDGQLVGEDSTTYLASEIAAKRIASQPKPIRLLVMLRHPTKRAYSQYWHMVRTGRLCHTFEDTIRYTPHSVLERSMYHDQLTKLFSHVSKDRVMVILFEEFLECRERVIRDICHFLEIEPARLPAGSLNAHRNASKVPKHPALHRFRNWLLSGASNTHRGSRLPALSSGHARNGGASSPGIVLETVERIHRKVNPLTRRRPPEMKPEIRCVLDDYFRTELAGLPDLLDRDVISVWFGGASEVA